MSTLKLPKPPSEKRLLANRANAAKSTGPITPEGKRKCALNAKRDNRLARAVLVEGEDRPAFLKLAATLHEQFQPDNAVEISLLNTLIVTDWRRLRFWEMERSIVDREIHRQEQTLLGETRATRAANAFATLSGSTRFEMFNRYELRYDRQYHRALKRLQQVQDRRLSGSGKINDRNKANLPELNA